ncbi:hypothetical protein QJS10_CPA03g02244 [Acorus calamus]|uniref:Uncharacterized protein n=1 Tax=Acorus calamus TaxID=4465 RepID=A0AAV9F5Z4_ACOCL|nr:hypothetical protein QJS10_CPA03g02244 [Acorus calamus]
MTTSSKIQLAPFLLLSLTLLSSATTDPPYLSEDPELQQCMHTCRHQQLFDPTEKQQCERRCEEYIREKEKRQRLGPLGNFKVTVFEVGPKKVTHPRHFDAEVLLYVMSGNGIIEFIGGDKRQMRKGDVVRVFAGTNFYVTTDEYERLHIVKLIQPVFINGQYQFFRTGGRDSDGILRYNKLGHLDVSVFFANITKELLLTCFEINASDYRKNFLAVAEEVKQSHLKRQQGRRWAIECSDEATTRDRGDVAVEALLGGNAFFEAADGVPTYLNACSVYNKRASMVQ